MSDRDSRFWAGVERIETDYVGDCNCARFRRRMRRKGFDAATIEERRTAINEESAHFSGRPQ
jgi:hypothetical protein